MSSLELLARDRLRDLDLDVELTVADTGTLALVGPSGAGKTTLLKVIAGLHRPREGRVMAGGERWLDTRDGTDLTPDERSCGFLFQDYALFPHLTAWRNVAFGLGGTKRNRHAHAVAELKRFGIDGLAGTRPGELSGGERQRVALARALVRKPAVLLLDEPLAALDSGTRRHAESELALTIRESGVPTVFVTHSFAEAATLADEICVIDRGKVVQRGSPGEVSVHPASGFVADLTGAVVMTGRSASEAPGGAIVKLDDGGFEVSSTDEAAGEVDVSVFPWEVSLETPGKVEAAAGLNRIASEVVSATKLGDKVSVALSSPRGLRAEIGADAARVLDLLPGARVEATWDPARTRLLPR